MLASTFVVRPIVPVRRVVVSHSTHFSQHLNDVIVPKHTVITVARALHLSPLITVAPALRLSPERLEKLSRIVRVAIN